MRKALKATHTVMCTMIKINNHIIKKKKKKRKAAAAYVNTGK